MTRTRIAHQWSPEHLAMLGKVPDTQLADELGVPVHIVFYKRRSLQIPALAPRSPESAQVPAHTRRIMASDELLQTIKEIEPALVERCRKAGLPIRALEDWQVVEIAINDLAASIRRARTRSAYAGGKADKPE